MAVFLVFQMGKAVAEPRDRVNGFRVIVCRLGQVDALSKGKVSLVEASCAIEMAISNLMMRAWHPTLFLCHLLGIHLQSSVGCVLVLVSSWNFPH